MDIQQADRSETHPVQSIKTKKCVSVSGQPLPQFSKQEMLTKQYDHGLFLKLIALQRSHID